jgi:D-sedoheptulose 7-phosphate isomerase
MLLAAIFRIDMTLESERIRTLFAMDIEAKIMLVDTLCDHIARAGLRLVNCLLADGKIFICGNGGSMANCLHFSAAMHHCFEVERPSLPVVSLSADISGLTGIANDGQFDQVFARQIQALGHSNDLLIVLTTTGHANTITQVVNTARAKGIDTIALTGRDGGILANHLGPEDIELRVPGKHSARIREVHLFILHCFCDLIDRSLFGTSTT